MNDRKRGWVTDAAVICGFCLSGIRPQTVYNYRPVYVIRTHGGCSCQEMIRSDDFGAFACFLHPVWSSLCEGLLLSPPFVTVRAYSICPHMSLCVNASGCVHMSVSLSFFFPLCRTVCITASWGFSATPAPLSSVLDH